MFFRGGLQQSAWKALRHLSHSSRGLLTFPRALERCSIFPQTSHSSRSSLKSCTYSPCDVDGLLVQPSTLLCLVCQAFESSR